MGPSLRTRPTAGCGAQGGFPSHRCEHSSFWDASSASELLSDRSGPPHRAEHPLPVPPDPRGCRPTPSEATWRGSFSLRFPGGWLVKRSPFLQQTTAAQRLRATRISSQGVLEPGSPTGSHWAAIKVWQGCAPSGTSRGKPFCIFLFLAPGACLCFLARGPFLPPHGQQGSIFQPLPPPRLLPPAYKDLVMTSVPRITQDHLPSRGSYLHHGCQVPFAV